MQAIPGFWVADYLSYSPSIVAADVNGDGLADVIMSGPGIPNSASMAVLFGKSDGTLSAPKYIPVPFQAYALAVGDVDGNGTADIVAVTAPTTVSILLGDGHGNFQAPVTQQTLAGAGPGPAYLVDLDGDGRLDLVVATQVSSTVNDLVWLKNTGGAFDAPATLANGANVLFTIADFNGDGKSDILYTAPGTAQSMHILINQGNGTFTDQVATGLNSLVGTATVLDFNLDGIADLVLQVPVRSGVAMLYSFAGTGN